MYLFKRDTVVLYLFWDRGTVLYLFLAQNISDWRCLLKHVSGWGWGKRASTTTVLIGASEDWGATSPYQNTPPYSTTARYLAVRLGPSRYVTLLLYGTVQQWYDDDDDAALTVVSVVSSNPSYSFFGGPKVKCYASCWNQLVYDDDHHVLR